jgi:hypothetical protein
VEVVCERLDGVTEPGQRWDGKRILHGRVGGAGEDEGERDRKYNLIRMVIHTPTSWECVERGTRDDVLQEEMRRDLSEVGSAAPARSTVPTKRWKEALSPGSPTECGQTQGPRYDAHSVKVEIPSRPEIQDLLKYLYVLYYFRFLGAR